MKNRIAVTGAGGGVGQSIIKSLYGTDYDVIALDGEVLGAGLYAVPESRIIPYCNRPEYIPTLLELCEKNKIDLLFPGLDAELWNLSKNKDAFSKIGTTAVVSSTDVIEIANNKMSMFEKLRSLDIQVPNTFSVQESHRLEFPFIIKQKIDGARSKNVFLVKNESDLNTVIKQIENDTDNFIAQEYISGDEYTCGTVNLEGECKGVIVMRRILRDGDTYKCFSVKDTVIENYVSKIVNSIKPFGACNIQLRVKNGSPYVFEINARCSGTTASRTLCGFNEPKMIADYLLKGEQPKYDVKELTILRYWNELVVDNQSIDNMNNHGFLTDIKTRL